MKKPILLLVDDDASVLEALTAELTSAFGEICRIEAFTEPGEVLAAMGGWAAEKRAIAVAIVDQKMPGMAGTDLLITMREHGRVGAEIAPIGHPAADMRAVLLTGYAGLASAVTAKNEARADRYLEKPWSADELCSIAAQGIASSLDSAGLDRFLLCRELTTVQELEDYLRLRYRVYRRTAGMAHLLPREDQGFDIDEYDVVSRHYGLYACSGTQWRLIGTLRIVQDEPGPAAPILADIVGGIEVLAARLQAARRYPLPLMKYFVDRDAVLALHADLIARGEQVMEPGRLTLEAEWRGRWGGNPTRHLVECPVAVAWFQRGVANALLSCVPPHVPFYRPYGFREAAGTAARYTPDLDCEMACLHGRSEWAPESTARITRRIAHRLTAIGDACRCSAFPTCLGGPFETSDFRESDLFCPERAHTILKRAAGHEEADPPAR